MMFSWRLIPMSVLFMQLFFFDVAYSTKDCQNYFYFSYFLIYHIGTSIKWTKSKSHFISFTNSLLNTNIFPLFFVFLISCLANSNCSMLLLLSRFSRVQLWPHRRQPTRLPRPWDPPGKNTGVGCHFLLQCRKGKSESEVAQSCPTLHDPMVCSLPGSSVHGIFQARVLEWGVIAFSKIALLEGVYSMNLNSSNKKCTIQSLLFICSAFSYLITQKNWISTKKIVCITW